MSKRKRLKEDRVYHTGKSGPSVEQVEDQVQIYMRLMKTVPTVVKKSDTIDNVKSECSKLHGVPLVHLKKVFFAGNVLQNERKLVDYDIRDGSTIDFFHDSGMKIRIHVKTSQMGKTIMVDVDTKDTILTVKRKIQDKEVTAGPQNLFYLGEELDDSRTIADYSIIEGSTIYSIFHQGNSLQIYVDVEGYTGEQNRRININMKSWYSIGNIKSLVESTLGVPKEKQNLYFSDVECENHETVGDLQIKEGQTLKLIYGMRIFVKTLTGKLLSYEVNGSHTIHDVQEMITKTEKIPVKVQRLIFCGKQVARSRTLVDIGIENGSTLQLVLQLY